MKFEDYKALVEINPRVKKEEASVLAKRFGVDIETIKEYRKKLKEEKRYSSFEGEIERFKGIPSIEELETTNYKVDSKPKVPIDAPTGYIVSSYKLNRDNEVQEKWIKLNENKILNEGLDTEILLKAINNIQSKKYSPYKKYIIDDNSCCLEIFITDFHINRLQLNGKSLEDRCVEYISLITNTIEKVKKLYVIDKIVFVVGSDMFNSDGFHAETKNRTPQNNLVHFDKAFEAAFNITIQAIDYLMLHCNFIDVITLVGNHDTTSSYYLGKSIEAYYRNYIGAKIKFDCSFDVRKIYTYGKSSWIYHHGNEKPEFIVQQFANFFPTEFTNKYVEIHTGDRHHSLVKEFGRVTFRQFPTASSSDMWTMEKGYYNTPKAISQIYDFEKGRIGEIEIKI